MDTFPDPFFDPLGRDERRVGMMSPFSSPFGVFGRMDRIMQQMNAEMTQGMGGMPPMQALLEEAWARLTYSEAARTALGDSLSVGRPVGQSSSQSVVNGEARLRVQLAVPVQGIRGEGLARIVADEGGLQELALDVGSRLIDIPLDGRERGAGGGETGDSDDDVIDASVLDKKVY